MLKAVLFLLCTSAAACAQKTLLDVTANLPPGVAAENVQVAFFGDGSKVAISCALAGSVDADPMYECNLPADSHSGTFVFKMPGYQPYSIKMASFEVPRGTVALALGPVRPEDSPPDADEARIDSIVLTRSHDDTPLRLQVTVHNLSRKTISITGIKMSGSFNRMCGGSHMPPNPSTYFTIADRLLLTPDKPGKAGITATVSSPEDRAESPSSVIGSGVLHPCSDNNFTLSAPVNFTMPARAVFEIELVFPSVGNQRSSGSGTTKSAPATWSTKAVIEGFPKVHFTFLTTDKDHPEISSHYGAN